MIIKLIGCFERLGVALIAIPAALEPIQIWVFLDAFDILDDKALIDTGEDHSVCLGECDSDVFDEVWCGEEGIFIDEGGERILVERPERELGLLSIGRIGE